MQYFVLILILSLCSCGESNSALNLRGNDAFGIQNADGALHFDPGTLNVDTSVTMSQGDDLRNRDLMELGGDNYEDAGKAMSVIPSDAADPTNPYAIAVDMPESGNAGLLLQSDNPNIVIIYEAVSYVRNQKFAGVIPRSELTIENGKVMFMFAYFGTFQAVRLRNPVLTGKIVLMDDNGRKSDNQDSVESQEIKRDVLDRPLKIDEHRVKKVSQPLEEESDTASSGDDDDDDEKEEAEYDESLVQTLEETTSLSR